jgi:hypothetical protein
MQNLSLNLELIVWDVAGNGTFQRRGEGDAGTVGAVAIASLGTDRVAAAMRNGSLDLEMIIWDVVGNGDLKRLGTGLADVGDKFSGERTNIGITAVPEWGKVVTAARNRTGDLQLTKWAVPNDGKPVVEGSATGEGITTLAVAGLDDQHIDHFATAIGNAQGQLGVTAWIAQP